MSRFTPAILCSVVGFQLLLTGSVPGGNETPDQEQVIPRKDSDLPPFAVARLGGLGFQHPHPTSSVAYMESHNQLATVSTDETIRVFNASTGALLYEIPEAFRALGGSWITAIGNPPRFCAGSKDGRTLAVVDPEKQGIVTLVAINNVINFGDHLFAATASPDGRYVATAVGQRVKNANQIINIWDTKTWTAVATIKDVTAPIHALALTQDNKSLVVATYGDKKGAAAEENNLQIYRIADGKLIGTLTGHPSNALCLAVSPRANLIASGHGGHVCIWDLDSHKLRKTFEVDTGYATFRPSLSSGSGGELAWSADGKSLFGGAGSQIFKLDAESGKFDKHATKVRFQSVSLIKGGQLLALAGTGAVRLWNPADGSETVVGTGHQQQVNALAFSPDGTLLASGSADGTARLWDVKARKELHSFQAPLAQKPDARPKLNPAAANSRNVVHSAAISPGGQMLAVGRSHSVDIWNVAGKNLVLEKVIDGAAVTSVQFVGNDQLVLSQSTGNLLLLTLKTMAWEELGNPTKTRIAAMVALPQSQSVAFLNSVPQGTVGVFDVSTKALTWSTVASSSPRATLSVSGDGKLLASGTRGGGFTVWDAATGKRLAASVGAREIGPNGPVIRATGFFAQSQLVVHGTSGGMVRVWDFRDGKMLKESTGHAGVVDCLAVSPNGELVATGGADSTIMLWIFGEKK
jgi:WD40 repeat protein